jgi:hypothetical protein
LHTECMLLLSLFPSAWKRKHQKECRCIALAERHWSELSSSSLYTKVLCTNSSLHRCDQRKWREPEGSHNILPNRFCCELVKLYSGDLFCGSLTSRRSDENVAIHARQSSVTCQSAWHVHHQFLAHSPSGHQLLATVIWGCCCDGFPLNVVVEARQVAFLSL